MTPADLPSADVLLFLNTKPDTTLRAASRCCSEKLVDSGTRSLPPAAGHMHLQPQARRDAPPAKRCQRPIWGDGFVNVGAGPVWFGLCSQCWHEWCAFHGPYQTMKANPAAATIDNEGLARLFITRGLDAKPLPPIDKHPGSQDTEAIDSLELWADLPVFDPEQYGEAEAA